MEEHALFQFCTSLQEFTRITYELIRLKQFDLLKPIFHLMEHLLCENNLMVDYAINNIYIPSLYAFIQDSRLKFYIMAILPFLLRKAYDRFAMEKENDNKAGTSTFIINFN